MTSWFDIAFITDHFTDEEVSFRTVGLQFDQSRETEMADLTNWSETDYEEQWQSELSRIMLTERSRGALITSLHNPNAAFQVRCWPMWKEFNLVHFHSQILFMLEGVADFNPARVCEHIGAHEHRDVDGNFISEWTVTVEAVEDFLKRQSQLGERCSTRS